MMNPLNIGETVTRHSLDEKLKKQLIALDKHIWQDCQINSVADLSAFEKKYQELRKNFDFCYDTEVNEFAPVYMHDGGVVQIALRGRNTGQVFHTKDIVSR